MMKNLIFAMILASASIGTAKGQQTQADSVVYIVGTSIFSEKDVTGFVRITTEKEAPLYLGPTHFFVIHSLEKNFYISFMHINFNLTELAKQRRIFADDTMETLVRSKSELPTYANVFDVDTMLATKTREQMWAWANSIRWKKIYIIDRNDFFTENGVQKMKLIQVGLGFVNKPPEEPIIEIE